MKPDRSTSTKASAAPARRWPPVARTVSTAARRAAHVACAHASRPTPPRSVSEGIPGGYMGELRGERSARTHPHEEHQSRRAIQNRGREPSEAPGTQHRASHSSTTVKHAEPIAPRTTVKSDCRQRLCGSVTEGACVSGSNGGGYDRKRCSKEGRAPSTRCRERHRTRVAAPLRRTVRGLAPRFARHRGSRDGPHAITRRPDRPRGGNGGVTPESLTTSPTTTC